MEEVVSISKDKTKHGILLIFSTSFISLAYFIPFSGISIHPFDFKLFSQIKCISCDILLLQIFIFLFFYADFT